MACSGSAASGWRRRVASFHRTSVASFAELLGTMGLHSSRELRPWHLMRRVGPAEVRHYAELYRYLRPGELLGEDPPEEHARALRAASAETFGHAASAVVAEVGEPQVVG